MRDGLLTHALSKAVVDLIALWVQWVAFGFADGARAATVNSGEFDP
jgi:hypothetical protein